MTNAQLNSKVTRNPTTMEPSNAASLRKTLGDIRGYAIDIYRALSHNRNPSRAVVIAYAGAIVSKVDAALTVPVRMRKESKNE